MACQMTNLVRLQCCQCGSIADINLAFSDANSAIALYMAKHQLCEDNKNVGAEAGTCDQWTDAQIVLDNNDGVE